MMKERCSIDTWDFEVVEGKDSVEVEMYEWLLRKSLCEEDTLSIHGVTESHNDKSTGIIH